LPAATVAATVGPDTIGSPRMVGPLQQVWSLASWVAGRVHKLGAQPKRHSERGSPHRALAGCLRLCQLPLWVATGAAERWNPRDSGPRQTQAHTAAAPPLGGLL